MKTALSVQHLSKSLGRKKILKDISFETYEGEVFGFLGPNGAGKTTTIKIATGLLSIDEGDILIDGKSITKNFEKAMAKVGGIVENPEMYKYLSGMENLKQYARMRGGIDQKRIDEVVELVGLKNRINEKIKRYSLGMRQRLGVAQAILHRPELLILDEPTNGLDPAGIRELRDILKELAHEEKISVIVSSHLMSEMELMCDRVGIIVNGSLHSVHTIDELIAQNSGEKVTYHIDTDNSEAAMQILSKCLEAEKCCAIDTRRVEIVIARSSADESIAEANSKLVKAAIKVFAISPIESKKLEDVFIELTGAGGNQIE